jgi:subtilisin family serine protease
MSIPVSLAALGAATLLAGASLAANAAAPVPDDPLPALQQVKQSSTARLGPWLTNLHEEYRAARARGVADSDFRSRNRALHVVRGTVAVQALATNGGALARSLSALGATHVRRAGSIVSARVPVAALDRLAADPALRYARPTLATRNALPAKAVSQGVVSLRANEARTANDVNGAGLEVGTLSDSFACNPPPFLPGAPTTTLAEDIANGELPAAVTILSEGPCAAGLIDEGRGMAQLIHDVAPGAAISFHTAWNSELDFAEGILRLEEHGADVIVDDVIYFAEPFFQDGMVGQAANIAVQRGSPYLSSAGNQARDSYQSAYRGVEVAVNPSGNLQGAGRVVREFHDFDPGPGVSILQPIALYPTAEAGLVYFSFQWDQPHRTASEYAWIKAGKSAEEAAALARSAQSDLDMVFFDTKGHLIRRCPPGVSRGITCQLTGDRNIGGDAVDIAALYYSGPPKAPQVFYVGFVKAAGPDPGVVKYVWFESEGTMDVLAFDTKSGTAYGHANAARVMSIGASSWYATVPFSTSGNVPPNDAFFPKIDLSPCVPACLNDFSSAGNIPVYFNRFGERLADVERRRNPSVTGPDGGNTTFFLSDSSYDDDDGDGRNSPFSTFISDTLDAPGDEFPNFFGTSASAPHVAAVAALMLDMKPGLTPAQVREALEATARPMSKRFTSARPIEFFPIVEVGPDGYDYDSGFGLVDAVEALEAAQGL